ncbi:hypothetical protein [Nocardia sp. NPDC004860]|uniref:hypothetical protein n=1 Tax=Nocardia sp. NPDC004860 TaxID=3154557 RepID=UPI0033AAE945
MRCTAALEALADDAVLAASDVLDPKLAPVETLSTQFRAQVQRTPDAVSGPAAGGCAAGRVRGAADAGGADGRCRFRTLGAIHPERQWPDEPPKSATSETPIPIPREPTLLSGAERAVAA